MTLPPSLPLVRIDGTPRHVGRVLGELARPVMRDCLDQSRTWHALQAWRDHPRLDRLAVAAQRHLPLVWDELSGMAEGLAMPMHDLFLWNCRGDLVGRTPDGCTTAAINRPGRQWIGHNEDGDPYVQGHCFIADVHLDDAPGFVSFCYPGSVPGHTFAVNRAGLVQTINNLRMVETLDGLPRQFLSRAVLDCTTLDAALDLLSGLPRAGAFHHTLGQCGDARMFSVEATPRACSVQPVSGVYGHANHRIHPGAQSEPQVITESSHDRQVRIDSLTAAFPAQAGGEEICAALTDRAADGLPIFRDDPADPDDENTLASAIFRLESDRVVLNVHQGGNAAAPPTHTLEIAPSR